MKPDLDFSNILEEAKKSIDSPTEEKFLSQVASQGILSAEISESRIEPQKEDIQKGALLWAEMFLIMESLYEQEDLKWINFYTGEEEELETSFSEYYQKSRMFGKDSEPLMKAFPFLTGEGIEKNWETLYKAYKKSSEVDSSLKRGALEGKRKLEHSLEKAKEGFVSTPAKRSEKFAIILVGNKIGVSTSADFIVEKLLIEENKKALYENGYIARVGSSTHKVYPKGKPTKANVSFHSTPKLLEDHQNLMWNLYRMESIRSGIKNKLEVDSREKYKKKYLEDWERATLNGVEE